jgi:hypothetical protein
LNVRARIEYLARSRNFTVTVLPGANESKYKMALRRSEAELRQVAALQSVAFVLVVLQILAEQVKSNA